MKCHLHYCDFRHSFNVHVVFWDTQRNKFPVNLGTFEMNYISTKLLESYGMHKANLQLGESNVEDNLGLIKIESHKFWPKLYCAQKMKYIGIMYMTLLCTKFLA